MLVELAPVDPRSLIQGDYMRLDYAIARQLRSDIGGPRDGHIVVTLDADSVAHFARVYQDGTPLRPSERIAAHSSIPRARREASGVYCQGSRSELWVRYAALPAESASRRC